MTRSAFFSRVFGLLLISALALSGWHLATIIADEKPAPSPATAPATSPSATAVSATASGASSKLGVAKPLVTVTRNTPATPADLQTIQAGIQQAVEKGAPATVGISIGGAFGSGVIVTEDGYILTAGHVAGRPGREANIIFPDGKTTVHAITLGVNRDMDSGMMKITKEGKYPHVELGRSGDLKLGQWCVTLGHPGGMIKERPPVVRAGRILYTRDDAIGTDCTIVGGDSGGPLLDMAGRLIGIHSRISDGITDNYHVPIDTFRDTWDRLKKGDAWGGPPAPGGPLLGINGQTYPQYGQPASYPGCKITDVFADTPADAAGLLRDDIILSFDGEPISSLDSLQTQIAKHKVGDEVTLNILRGDDKKDIKVKLGRRE